jgi:1-acyl-sn-glycerol-3-phosphate acyltransferase
MGAPGGDRFDISSRDLTFAESGLPALRRFVHAYFRATVEGMDHVPEGPVLLVANHSGGSVTPDSIVFILEFLDRFGVERPLYWLGHEALVQLPVLGDFLRRCGVLPADPDAAAAALAAGGALIVYPGGEVELHRPWSRRNEILFHGRTGFVRLAAETGAPIVPVVAAGGHNTYLPITDGRILAQALGLRRRFNIKTLPVSLALPWGLNISDFLLHLPLPARIQVRVLEPLPVGPDADLTATAEGIVARMQAALDELTA